MSERELIETALSVPRQMRLSVDTEVIEDAARQYLASLDSPSVPQEGVSDGALAQALLDYPAYGHWIGAESHNEHLAAALAPLLEKLRAARNLANSIEEENARLKARIEHWEKTADRHWSARHAAEARVKELEALLTIEVKSKQKTPSPSP